VSILPSVLRGLFLDLDNTLVDRDAAFARWARQHTSDPAVIAALTDADDGGLRPRPDFAAAAIGVLGLARAPAELAAQFPVELAAHVEPEPGLRDTLALLHRRCRLAVVSNGGAAGQRAKLARLGLDGLIDAVFISAEVGLAKPDPAIFLHALRWAELPAGDAAFVGDNPRGDLAPAAALGMTTIWRERGSWPDDLAPPSFVIRRIPELLEVCA